MFPTLRSVTVYAKGIQQFEPEQEVKRVIKFRRHLVPTDLSSCWPKLSDIDAVLSGRSITSVTLVPNFNLAVFGGVYVLGIVTLLFIFYQSTFILLLNGALIQIVSFPDDNYIIV